MLSLDVPTRRQHHDTPLSPFFPDFEADKEASEMLTVNAQNLMKAVSEVLYATEAASIHVSLDSKAAQAGLLQSTESYYKAMA